VTRPPLRTLLPVLLLAMPALAKDLAEDGAAIFAARCTSCHSAEPGAPPGPGPNLAGVIGRRVGGDPGFDYSPVLRAAGGEVWDPPMLERFLEGPEEMFPGLWMGGNGLPRAADRAAVTAFLCGRAGCPR
jgi:cytochrome c